MADVAHYFSADISASASGDLLVAGGILESQQRILRRLLTNPGDYIWQPDYGAGLPSYIGRPLNVNALTALVKTQMYLEPSVSHNPEPLILFNVIPNGIYVRIQYVDVESGQTAILSFDVTP